jgi:branched-chain amino acid transport system ATP-binding protein
VSEEIMRVEHVTKRYGGLVAVNDVSIQVNRGEIIGLIGPNGAGKTTLFNILSGMEKCNTGRIYFLGQDITHKQVHEICELGIGRTFQIVQPFENLTVLENVMVGSFLHQKQVEEARAHAQGILELVGMQHLKDVPGHGLNLRYMKSMEVARALATNPSLLLLDEVMAGLNPTGIEAVVATIKRIRDSGVTILVIEHVIKAIMSLSDRIYVLDQGKLIAEGLPDEVINNEDVIKSYLGAKKHA